MAVLCKDYNLLYICIPKTGSTSISNYLISELGGTWFPEESVINENGLIVVDKKHSMIKDLVRYGILSEDMLDSLTVFTTVRNPFDMVLSNYFFEKQIYERFKFGMWFRLGLGLRTYFYLKKRLPIDKKNEYSWIMPQAKRYLYTVNHSFEDYVDKFYAGKNSNLYATYTDGAKAFYLKLEKIEKELENLFGQIGIKKSRIELPHLSKSNAKSRHYKTYYTERAHKIIKNSFRNELEQFDYEF